METLRRRITEAQLVQRQPETRVVTTLLVVTQVTTLLVVTQVTTLLAATLANKSQKRSHTHTQSDSMENVTLTAKLTLAQPTPTKVLARLSGNTNGMSAKTQLSAWTVPNRRLAPRALAPTVNFTVVSPSAHRACTSARNKISA